MVLAVRVPFRDAEAVLAFLRASSLIHQDYSIKKDQTHLIIPVRKRAKVPSGTASLIQASCAPRQQKQFINAGMQKLLTPAEYRLLPRAFDAVGDILILELPRELEKKEKRIAAAYLSAFPGIRTVAKKSAVHAGRYRTRRLTILAGRRKKEAICRESGLRLKVHLEKMYFSPRLAAERLRIARQVKGGEDVLVMFSGCAPYCCVIARHSAAKRVTGIELNPDAHRYALENVKLNKLEGRITLHAGDVRTVLPKLKRKFDRIIMPLPKTGEEFLPLALQHIKKDGTIHYYTFMGEAAVQQEKGKIRAICRQQRKHCKILRVVKAGQHAPYVRRMCVDMNVI